MLIMQKLHHKSYMIAMGVSDSVNTRQVFLGELPMLYGGMQVGPWGPMPTTFVPGTAEPAPTPNVWPPSGPDFIVNEE